MDVSSAGTIGSFLARTLLPACLLVACGGENSSDSPTPGPEDNQVGRLVIVGGGLQSENIPVYRAVLDGRDGTGPLCIIPTASGTPERSMEGYVSAFDSVGGPGTSRGVLLTVDDPEKASREDVARELAGCAGFFFTGGSQDRVTRVFRPDGESTLSFDAIRSRFEEGAVVAGSSAGAAIMTDPMIAGGGSLEALEAGVTLEDSDDGVWVTTGLGFMETGIIDQHFLARGRWGRLLVTVLNGEGDGVGFGIDENTALVVEGDSARVIGESGVIFLDARSATRDPDGRGGTGVRLFLLGRGDVVHLPEGRVQWNADKEPVAGNGEAGVAGEADLFAPWTLLDVLYALATGTAPDMEFSIEGFRAKIARAPDFQVVALKGEGAESGGIRGTPAGLGMGPLTVGISTDPPTFPAP